MNIVLCCLTLKGLLSQLEVLHLLFYVAVSTHFPVGPKKGAKRQDEAMFGDDTDVLGGMGLDSPTRGKEGKT